MRPSHRCALPATSHSELLPSPSCHVRPPDSTGRAACVRRRPPFRGRRVPPPLLPRTALGPSHTRYTRLSAPLPRASLRPFASAPPPTHRPWSLSHALHTPLCAPSTRARQVTEMILRGAYRPFADSDQVDAQLQELVGRMLAVSPEVRHPTQAPLRPPPRVVRARTHAEWAAALPCLASYSQAGWRPSLVPSSRRPRLRHSPLTLTTRRLPRASRPHRHGRRSTAYWTESRCCSPTSSSTSGCATSTTTSGWVAGGSHPSRSL